MLSQVNVCLDLQPLARSLDAAIPPAMADRCVPGVSVALFNAGGDILARCYGQVRAGSGVSVTPQTLFEAASLTKPVFATIVMGLAEQGVLDLDRPLPGYLPDHPGLAFDLTAITPRLVLCHRTGLPNWVREGQALVPRCAPGAEFTYSGLGYMYLQVAVEHLTGRTLQELFVSSVREAASMPLSTLEWVVSPGLGGAGIPGGFARVDQAGLPVPARPAGPGPESGANAAWATGHDAAGAAQPKRDWPSALAAASLHTTPYEYARLMRLFLAPRDLPRSVSASGLGSMLEPRSPAGEGVAWGMGWGIEETAAGRMLWHWGDNGPFKNLCVASPDLGLGLIVMTNGHAGLQVGAEAIRACFPFGHPAVEWLRRFYE